MKEYNGALNNILKFSNIRDASCSLKNIVVEKIISILKKQNKVCISLPGGRTPNLFFNMLAQSDDLKGLWHKIHIFPGDERFVAYNSSLSNSQLIYNSLISLIAGDKPGFYPVDTKFDNVYQVAKKYKSVIYNVFDIDEKSASIPKFDIMILGIGIDGHTASIFPNTMEKIKKIDIIAGIDAPSHITPKVPRITMTMPLINNSKFKFFLFSGKQKLALFNTNDKIYPFQYVENPCFFYCD